MQCAQHTHTHTQIVCWNIIQSFFNASGVILKNLTWSISIQVSDVVKHKTEKTWELKKEGQKKLSFWFLKIIIYALIENKEARAESWPVAGPVHRHIQWTGRCSRCTSASSPAGPCSGGTTAGSKQLPLSLQENTVTGKHPESSTHSAKIFHSKEMEDQRGGSYSGPSWESSLWHL